jgi:hypothetical protein
MQLFLSGITPGVDRARCIIVPRREYGVQLTATGFLDHLRREQRFLQLSVGTGCPFFALGWNCGAIGHSVKLDRSAQVGLPLHGHQT